MLSVVLARSADAHDRGDEWQTLSAASPGSTPFMAPSWARAWWTHWGSRQRPFTIVVRDGEQLVGLAPLAAGRRGPLRLLTTVGIEPGDYWDVIATAERRAEVCALVAGELARHGRVWDALILRCLPPDSPLPQALTAAGLRIVRTAPVRAPSIELPDDFDGYLRRLPSQRRQNLRRHLKRLDSDEVQLRVVTDPSQVPATLERWQVLRREQWQAAGRTIEPEHLSPRFLAFMIDAVSELLPTGAALVWQFSVDGKPVGVYVNFADPETFYWYLGGFAPDVAHLGLGKIAIAHGIRTSIAAGRRRFDFARGAEPYKYWYGAQDRLLHTIVVGTSRPRSQMALTAARSLIAARSAKREPRDLSRFRR